MHVTLEELRRLIEDNEDWLTQRIIYYSREREYTKYTSTREEEWRISVSGISDTLVKAVEFFLCVPELGPDENHARDPITLFAVIEVQKHRTKGGTLCRFLGLIKYYKQSYLDLLAESRMSRTEQHQCRLFIERCFDRIEIGFCMEWNGMIEITKLAELQYVNRVMANDKNKYLTILESLSEPVLILNSNNHIENMNHAAAQLFSISNIPISSYYDENQKFTVSWVMHEINEFLESKRGTGSFEKEIMTNDGPRLYSIKLKRMLDIKAEFSGTVVIFHDLTQHKRMEQTLGMKEYSSGKVNEIEYINDAVLENCTTYNC